MVKIIFDEMDADVSNILKGKKVDKLGTMKAHIVVPKKFLDRQVIILIQAPIGSYIEAIRKFHEKKSKRK